MHEIGHSLGFSHTSDSTNVMYEKGTGMRFDLWHLKPEGYHSSKFGNTGDGDEVLLCKGTYMIEVEADRLVDIHLDNPNPIILTDQEGNIIDIRTDTICGEDQTKNFKQTCVVDRYATLNIWYFEEGDIVGYTVKIDRIDNLPEINMNWDKNYFKYSDAYSDIFG